MKRKIFLIALVALISIASMSFGALAATQLETIQAYLNKGLRFEVNGKAWTPKDDGGNVIYPITYNNTTYLPVRYVAEAVGLEVGWDAGTQTVILGKGSGQAGQTGTNTGVGQSRSNPAPIGTEVPFAVNDILLGEVTGSIKVEEVIRGEEAWARIGQANMFNDEPREGFEYILAKIYVKVNSIEKEGAQYAISSVSFKLVSGEGKDYETLFVVEPDPVLEANLYAGASHSGWAAFQVAKTDPNPLITFGRKYDGTGGLWFKTTK